MALVRITKAIFNNKNRILPISVYNDDVYDIDNLYIGLPAVLNKDGVDHVVKLNLSDDEDKALKHSANILKESIDSIIIN